MLDLQMRRSSLKKFGGPESAKLFDEDSIKKRRRSSMRSDLGEFSPNSPEVIRYIGNSRKLSVQSHSEHET